MSETPDSTRSPDRDDARAGRCASPRPARVGLIGFGHVGRYVYEEIRAHPELGLELAFVHDARPESLADVPAPLVLESLDEFADRRCDLVVEMAHPAVTRAFGVRFLSATDYMPLSLTALGDPALLDALLDTAEETGTRLFIPHGAAVGIDSLFECADLWDSVTVTMRKNPKNLDFAEAPRWRDEPIEREAVLYDGTTRGLCPLFPRNVNAHAAVALAGIGFDRTRSVLIADPSLEVSVIEIEARGAGGVRMHIERSNPLTGVSGVFTYRSILFCIRRAKGSEPGLRIC